MSQSFPTQLSHNQELIRSYVLLVIAPIVFKAGGTTLAQLFYSGVDNALASTTLT
ncbi:MAG: hypothetical protein ABL921_14365 [Pirellula sp.]